MERVCALRASSNGGESMSDPTDLLKQMAERSSKKLNDPKNLAKGSWLDMTDEQIVNRIRGEMFELRVALEAGVSWDDIADEAADVYHFASMGADPARKKQ
jgi:hypothetical protein